MSFIGRNNGSIIVVGHYKPAGNMVGSFKKHVHPVGSDSSPKPKEFKSSRPSPANKTTSDDDSVMLRRADFDRLIADQKKLQELAGLVSKLGIDASNLLNANE